MEQAFTGCRKMRFWVELAFRPAFNPFYFCHPERTSVREGYAFLAFSAASLAVVLNDVEFTLNRKLR